MDRWQGIVYSPKKYREIEGTKVSKYKLIQSRQDSRDSRKGVALVNIAAVKFFDVADGVGVRTALFVSGCRRHCKGCHNEKAWDFEYGEPFTAELQERIIQSLEPEYIDGLSVLGGEPYEPENERELIPFLEKVTEKKDKSVWIYTGYTYDEIKDRELTKYADVLVDGEFRLDERDAGLAFKGSRNQRIITLRNKI